VATLSLISPALGYVETKTKGTVGAYTVTDTHDSPGAICHYKPTTPASVRELNHIYVNAPDIKAIAGAGMEKVAWRFIIQRMRFGGDTWKRIYRSPLWSNTTDSSHNAAFGQEGANVTVPQPYATGGYGYRVIVKSYWYKHDGTTVRGSATGRIEWYALANGVNPGPFDTICPDYDD
jgi:hypothetical protein